MLHTIMLLTQCHSCAVDEMGGRLDELEKSISDLIQQAGVDDGGGKPDAPVAVASGRPATA
jgi:hypothetical protein